MFVISIILCIAIFSAKSAANSDEAAFSFDIDFEKIHLKAIGSIESQVMAANNFHSEASKTKPGTFIGYLYYSKSGTKCQSSPLTSIMYMKANQCMASTNSNGTSINGYYKYSCSIGGNLNAQYFTAEDNTCSGVSSSYNIPLNTCPTITNSPVYDCASDSTLLSKFKDVKGVVMKSYSASKGCKKDDFSALKSVYYSTSLFTIDNNNVFTCLNTNAIVCDGTKGIQQLQYSKPKCKGTTTKVNSLTFPVCQMSSTNAYSTMSCSGPAHL